MNRCPVNTLDGTHQWSYSLDQCILCGINGMQIMSQNNTLYTCCPNGSPNNIKWSGYSSQWECSSCGAPKSNDPNYLWSNPAKQSDFGKSTEVPKSGTGCECGSSKVGSDRHSGYCPLYKDVK